MTINLICPVRGPLAAEYFAKDGLTVTEEARRIDCITYLLGKGYPKENIKCETIVIKHIGNAGKNSLRADITVYDQPVEIVKSLDDEQQNFLINLIGEIKRDSKAKVSAVKHQLEPALRQVDKAIVYGVYWDDTSRHLYIKQTKNDIVTIIKDELGNIPEYGNNYKYKKLKYDDLIKPEDISATLMDIANILRSNHINDESIRYRETVKLLLAKYIDERECRESGDDLLLQVYQGADAKFSERVKKLYKKTATFYSRAKSIFANDGTDLGEKTLKEIVTKVQGLNLLNSSSDSMQQVFMTFVPAVFKKDLDQYFTPLTLINCIIDVLKPGPNDKIADPAMGTADFLTAAMQYRFAHDDGQIINRVYGMDKDAQAYELAIINMILNKDGQTNLHNLDSIENHDMWTEQLDIAVCNPPFGSRTVETRAEVLQHYDLAHVWALDEGGWKRTDELMDSQQLGILFIERCFKLLAEGGKIGIILPEGYLCTSSYGYVRTWILEKFKIIGLVELPRRIFLKSEADLRSNILFAIKCEGEKGNYPIHSELVRKVGYKLGKGFFPIPMRDPDTGLEKRDATNALIIDTDFLRVKDNFLKFIKLQAEEKSSDWQGARITDILVHPQLDMKPRRISHRALSNAKAISSVNHVRLGDIADVVDETVFFRDFHDESDQIYLVEGQDIRAAEGLVVLKHPEKRWEVEVRKTQKGYKVRQRDVIVGLVRPERRNIGFYTHSAQNVYASSDGVAIVRERVGDSKTFPIEWIFQALRTERCRIQFWTESGGTSYGKLTLDQIKNVLIPKPEAIEIENIKKSVKAWAKLAIDVSNKFHEIWDTQDKVVILNSPLIGLEGSGMPVSDDDEDEEV